MAIDTTVFAADLAGMISDLPTVAKLGSTTFDCSATTLSEEQMLILTGNQDKKGVQITFPVSVIGSETLAVQGRLQLKYPNGSTFSNYQVASIDSAPDLVSYTVTLMQDNRA